MSRGYNKAVLLGGLTKDPELKYTQGGTAYMRFTLACGYSVKDKDGQWVEKADYVPCTAWDNVAATIAKYCVKGSQLFAEGKVFTNTYKDKGGNNVWDTSVRVDNIRFAGGRRKDEGGSAGASQSSGRASPGRDDSPAFSQYEAPRGGDFSFRDGPDVETVDIPF